MTVFEDHTLPKRAPDTSREWRALRVFVHAPALGGWVDERHVVSVKPGASAREREQELGRDYAVIPGITPDATVWLVEGVA